MKKLFTLFFVGSLGFTPTLLAQNISEAVRYSDQNIEGTARYRAMSGAFGALGGDLSAIQVNPAGSAVFKNSLGSITLSNANVDNKALYGNRITETSENNLNFNQIGAVFVFKNYEDSSASPINKLVFSLNYDQTRDNENSFLARGSSSNSIDSHFLNQAQGLPLSLLSFNGSLSDAYARLGEQEGTRAQEALLAYEGFILNPVDDTPDNTAYTSNVSAGTFDQEYLFESTGYNGKFSINGSLQLHEKFYLGVNLNSHFINYDEITRYYENNANAGTDINTIEFTNRTSTTGSGFSAQIGGIAKVSSFLRLGASLETPTWYLISRETTQDLFTNSNANGRAFASPNVINVFPEYRLRTPAKFTGSAAFVFGKKGLLSIDYSYKDYSTTKFSSGDDFSIDDDYTDLNREIRNTLQATSAVRVGGEFRHLNWRFRAGLSYETSPYEDESILGDTEGYSLGFGYNFGKIKLDVAYDTSEQDSRQQFVPNSTAFTNNTSINRTRDNITVTFSLNL